MLVKREWDDLCQGDMVYLPGSEIRGICLGDLYQNNQMVIGIPETGSELICLPFWKIMRFEGMYPYWVTERGIRTGEMGWGRVRDVTGSN